MSISSLPSLRPAHDRKSKGVGACFFRTLRMAPSIRSRIAPGWIMRNEHAMMMILQRHLMGALKLIEPARRVQRKESGHDEVAGVAFDFLDDGDLSKKN